MRPSPIIRFERVALLAIALGMLNTALDWDHLLGRMQSPYPVSALCVSQALYFGLYALLIWLISRKGNAVARGIFAALVVFIGLPYLATLPPASEMTLVTVSAIAQCLLTMGSLVLLFGRDGDRWFAGSRPVDPEIFR